MELKRFVVPIGSLYGLNPVYKNVLTVKAKDVEDAKIQAVKKAATGKLKHRTRIHFVFGTIEEIVPPKEED